MKPRSANKLATTRRDALTGGIGAASLAVLGTKTAPAVATFAASVAITTDVAQAGQVSTLDMNVTEPATGVVMQPDYARTIAQMAYVWGWPMVNMINRRAAITQAPQPGHLNGVLPAAPRGQIAMLADYIEPSETFVTCPNQDVVYGLGFFSLDEEPVVIQVPDFGDRFWVYALYDARTDQFGHLGKPYKSKPGFYLLVGPRWKGLKPAGITDVIRCSTSLANAIPRVFPGRHPRGQEGDPAGDQPDRRLSVEGFHRQDEDDRMEQGPETFLARNRTGEETKWVIPEKFFDEFGEVLDIVDPLPGEEALYGQFRLLLDAAAKDPELKRVLVATAVETEQKVIHPFFEWKHNGRPAGNGWNRSTNNAQFGIDYFNRTGTAKSNMFDNRPNETQYFYTDYDGAGAELNGGGSYDDHVLSGTGTAGQRLLVIDAVQRQAPLPPE